MSADPIAGPEKLANTLRTIAALVIILSVVAGLGIAVESESFPLGIAVGGSGVAYGVVFLFFARVLELLKIIVERLGRFSPPGGEGPPRPSSWYGEPPQT